MALRGSFINLGRIISYQQDELEQALHNYRLALELNSNEFDEETLHVHWEMGKIYEKIHNRT